MITATLSFEEKAIPSALKAREQWVCWRAVPNGERIEKIPVCADTGSHASSTDPETWTDFTTAVMKAFTTDGLGIGFVFTQGSGITGIDLDKCRDAETGVLEPWAEEIVRDLNSYTEISPSGRGLHIYVLGELPPGRMKKGQIEAYQRGRFFTVTGQHLQGTPATVEERSGNLVDFHARYLAEPIQPTHHKNNTATVHLADEDILTKCHTAKNAAKFEALWRGDWNGYPSQSDADLALLGQLKFYTQDAGQLDRLFRRSGLMREKWDERRGEQTYGERSINEALKHVQDAYSGARTNGTPATMSGMSGQVSEEWPDLQPIKAELCPVETLHLKMIPSPFRDWIKDVSDRMQCPPDFMAAAMLAMTGSVIGAGCGIRPKKHDDWTVVPNYWGGVVGRPSMLKTPAIAEAMKPLDALEAAAKQAHDEAMKEHGANFEAFKAQKEALRSEMCLVAKGKTPSSGQAMPTMDSLKHDFTQLEEPKPPIWRRYKTNDATIEKMAELQVDNPRGILLFRDELIGLFATWDKENHESDRAFYLEGWNGMNPFTWDRIGRGTGYVPNLCVSLFGGIQPTKLSRYLHAAMRGHNNDGLVQRLQLLVYPDEPKTWALIDTPVNRTAKDTAHRVIERLSAMDFRQHGALGDEGEAIPYYRFDEAAQQVFYEWLQDLEGRLRNPDDEPVIVEHLGKYRSLMPSLALVFHLLTVANDSCGSGRQVTKESAECAAAWCTYLESHARRVYGLVTNATAQAASHLASKLKQGALSDGFTVRHVYRKEWSLLDDPAMAENACEELVSLGWLREKVTMPAPGQKGKTEYLINPKVRQL